MKNQKTYLAMISVQIVYTGMAMLSKAAMTTGMNPFVFVVYRQAFATLALAPFAFFLESNKVSPLTFNLLCKIFMLSLCGLTLSLNLYYVALNYTTATFAAATTNTIPVITFIMALLLRLESVCIRRSHGIAKVLGSVVSLSGAMVFALVKGPALGFINRNTPSNPKQSRDSPASAEVRSTGEWIKGCVIMISANSAFCLWLVLQSLVVKQYTAKVRFVTLQCLFSCIQTAVWAAATDQHPSAWKLQWGLPLLSVAYCGLVVTGMTYWVQVWALEKKGPVFTAMFTPLALVLTSVLSAMFLKEPLFWGSMGGGMLLVIGLYSVLWGKNREEKERDGLEVAMSKQQGQVTKEESITLECMTTQH